MYVRVQTQRHTHGQFFFWEGGSGGGGGDMCFIEMMFTQSIRFNSQASTFIIMFVNYLIYRNVKTIQKLAIDDGP